MTMKGTMRERRPRAWELRVYLGRDPETGKPRQQSRMFYGGKREAQTALAVMVAHAPDRPTVQHTVGHLLRLWLEERTQRSRRDPRDISPHTVTADRVAIETLFLPAIGHIPLAKLGPSDLDAIYTRLRAEGLASSSIVRRHSTIRGALERAVGWGWIKDNPASRASPGRARFKEIVPPTAEQVRLLITEAEKTSPVLAMFLFLAAVTGCRRGELCALRWGSIDVERAAMVITDSVVQTREGVVFKDPKNHKFRRVSLDRRTVDLLLAHRRWREELAGIQLTDEAFVFSLEPDCSAPLRPNMVTTFFGRLCRRVGLDHVDLHHFRHFATTALMSRPGARPDTIAARQGHSVNVMLGTYAHAVDGADQAEAAYMGQLLAGQQSAPHPEAGGVGV